MSKTNLNEQILDFSNSWEDYVKDCIRTNYDPPIYYPIKDYKTHLLLKNEINNELKSLVGERVYKTKTSDDQGQLAGIPWLSIKDKNVTTSTQRGFYISYLFSRNAKKLYLSVALGVTQFEDLYGANNKTTQKIESDRKLFLSNFIDYSPVDIEKEVSINLKKEEDKTFSRDFSKSINRIADYYIAGCFFSSSYNHQDEIFLEQGLVGDLNKYIECYRKIVSDPRSSLIIDILDEIVHEEVDTKMKDLDYEVPTFSPLPIVTSNETPKKEKKKLSKNNSDIANKNTTPTKNVGLAGEEHVYEKVVHDLKQNGKDELANRVIKQYENMSEFPGYDMKSFDCEGNEIYIEVKSTKGKKNESFNITVNEVNAAKKFSGSYYIYPVTDALAEPKISHVVPDPIACINEKRLSFEPITYNMSFSVDE